jgi:iron complex outermembrane receptor protein
LSTTLSAQQNKGVSSIQDYIQIYKQAVEAYEFGHFEEADSILKDVAGNMKGELQINAYRLLALSNLNMDNPEAAENYVSKLLAADPYYKAYNEAPRFIDLVENLKAGKSATITTASQQAESVEEAPVPVTLITEEMIKMSGARNLKEVLITYVPGMTDIASNEEMNIAMRGVYASRQEKILIMLNGHRLNSYSTNVATPDFSISLEKVKQIEVLRGPASSLYGGVALTGVINIITKEAEDVDGLQIKASVGNYGQIKGDLLFGRRYINLSFLSWANIYHSDGQSFHLGIDEQSAALVPNEGNITIDAYNRKPTYNMGFIIQWKDLTFTYNNMFSKMVPPYTMSVMFAPYSYGKYGTFNGNKPGFATSSNNFEIKYSKTLGNWGLLASLTYDRATQQQYQIAGDYIPLELGFTAVPTGTTDTIPVTTGIFQNHVWHESTLGGHLQGSFSKKWGKHDVTALLGAHVNRLNIDDTYYEEGDEYNRVLKVWDESKNLVVNHELNADTYFQLKYKWKNIFIVNAGIRYDFKHRYNYQENEHEDIHVLSPRIAGILNLPKWTAKLSYSKSFVDAPYFYRNSMFDTSWGGGLNPEYMNSLQASVSSKELVKGLNAEVNIFYNIYHDIVSNFSGMYYFNGGKLKTWGTELSLQYTRKRFHAVANMTWQKLIEKELYDNVIGDNMKSVPSLTWNAVLQYEILKGLKLHTRLNFMGRQHSYSLDYMTIEVNEYEVPARCIVSLGTNYNIRNFEIGFNAYNLLNTRYEQGGSSTGQIRQQGFWFMADISYKF